MYDRVHCFACDTDIGGYEVHTAQDCADRIKARWKDQYPVLVLQGAGCAGPSKPEHLTR